MPAEPTEVALGLHDPRVVDARRRLGALDALDGIDEANLGQMVRVMDAMFRWREAERRVSEASQRYMRLGETDMKALRLLIVQSDRGEHVTARDLSRHLGISSAATTKLLDRLEVAGHVRRTRHPTDRRAIAVVITPETRKAAELTVGREHARRFRVIAMLTPAERETVVRFLEAMSVTGEADWSEPRADPGE